MKFLAGESALLIGKCLVIADLHLGVECELGLAATALSKAKEMAKKIGDLADEYGAKRIIILGDVKHLLPKSQERWSLRSLERKSAQMACDLVSNVVDAGYEVMIIKGNHDGGLNGRGAEIRKEFLMDNTLFVHGHRWPTAEAVHNCIRIICAHAHPCWAFIDSFGHRELKKVFVVGRTISGFFKKYKTKQRNIEIVVMPTFNNFVSGTAVNEHTLIGPLLKEDVFKTLEVYLLDGTQVK